MRLDWLNKTNRVQFKILSVKYRIEMDGLIICGWMKHFLPFRVTCGRGQLTPVILISNACWGDSTVYVNKTM